VTVQGLEFHVEDADGNYLAFLDGAAGKAYLATLSDVGSGSFKIHAADAKATAANLAVGNVVLVRRGNTNIGAWLIENLQETLVDSGEEAARWITVSGRGLLALLDYALVYPGDFSGDPVKGFRRSTNTTKANVLIKLLDEFAARGGAGLTVDFSEDLDSGGAPFTDEVTLEYKAGQTVMDVARNLVAYGLELSATADKYLQAWVSKGTDRRATVIFRHGQSLLTGTSATDGRNMSNVILGEGKGMFVESIDTASIATHGRREHYLQVNNAWDAVQVRQANRLVLEGWKEPVAAYELAVLDDPYEPFQDYDVGDMVTVSIPGKLEGAFRVLGISTEEIDESGRLQVTLELNDLRTEYLQRVQRAFEVSLLMARPGPKQSLASAGGAGFFFPWIGLSEGPRVGLWEYDDDNGDPSYVFEVAGPDNMPLISAGAVDNGDPDSGWANIGYETFPRIHFETVPGYARKLPLVDTALLQGVTGTFKDFDGNTVTVENGLIVSLGV
jgi:hypothetical protein